jgi:hypothetical protein
MGATLDKAKPKVRSCFLLTGRLDLLKEIRVN